MKVLSASQAVTPAIERTSRMLFRPFDSATYLKLCAAACVTEGCWIHFSSTTGVPAQVDSTTYLPGGFTPEVIAWIIFGSVSAIVFCVMAMYLVARLRFAFFHCLIHETREIRPGWSLYREAAMRYFLGSLIVFAAFLGMVLLVVGALAVMVFTVFTVRTSDGKLDPGVFFILFYPRLGFAFLVGVLAAAASTTMRDFMLPHMAIENLTFGQAWRAARASIRAARESFFSYFILRLLLPVLAFFVLFVAAAFPLMFLTWILSTSATGFHDMLEDATGEGAGLRVGLEILFGSIGAALALFTSFCLGGPVCAWSRNYALVFYGGRYKAFGDALEPPAAA
jgi:hypothetical protein